MAIRALEIDSTSGKLRVQLENLGPNLGRVQEVTASAGNTASPPGPGFPLFPHMLRWTTLDWPGRGEAGAVSVRFAKFTRRTPRSRHRVTLAAMGPCRRPASWPP